MGPHGHAPILTRARGDVPPRPRHRHRLPASGFLPSVSRHGSFHGSCPAIQLSRHPLRCKRCFGLTCSPAFSAGEGQEHRHPDHRQIQCRHSTDEQHGPHPVQLLSGAALLQNVLIDTARKARWIERTATNGNADRPREAPGPGPGVSGASHACGNVIGRRTGAGCGRRRSRSPRHRGRSGGLRRRR